MDAARSSSFDMSLFRPSAAVCCSADDVISTCCSFPLPPFSLPLPPALSLSNSLSFCPLGVTQNAVHVRQKQVGGGGHGGEEGPNDTTTMPRHNQRSALPSYDTSHSPQTANQTRAETEQPALLNAVCFVAQLKSAKGSSSVKMNYKLYSTVYLHYYYKLYSYIITDPV